MAKPVLDTAKWSGIGALVTAGFSLAETFIHYSRGDFETLQAASTHVAEPENVAIAAGLCLVFGAGMALMNDARRTLNLKP